MSMVATTPFIDYGIATLYIPNVPRVTHRRHLVQLRHSQIYPKWVSWIYKANLEPEKPLGMTDCPSTDVNEIRGASRSRAAQ